MVACHGEVCAQKENAISIRRAEKNPTATMIFLFLSLLGLVPTFQKSKCKKLLNTTMERIKLLSSRRDAQLRQLQNDLVKLVQLGRQQKVQVWLGRICKELQLRSVYIKISAYCQRVQVNLTDIAGNSNCPENLQEPLAGLCFAASCCADLPELQELREIFTMKYGKNFVTSAQELGKKCLVKEEAVEEEIIVDDELKQGIEQALQQQQDQESQAMKDAEDPSTISLSHQKEGADIVLTSVQSAPAIQESAIAVMAGEENMRNSQALASQKKGSGHRQGTNFLQKRQKSYNDVNHAREDYRNASEGDKLAITQRHNGKNLELALYVKEPEFSLPPQRTPPLPPMASPSFQPTRSASMPSFSAYMKHATSPADLSPPYCSAMAKHQYRECNKEGIHAHPRLPTYEDLVANFTALKH